MRIKIIFSPKVLFRCGIRDAVKTWQCFQFIDYFQVYLDRTEVKCMTLLFLKTRIFNFPTCWNWYAYSKINLWFTWRNWFMINLRFVLQKIMAVHLFESDLCLCKNLCNVCNVKFKAVHWFESYLYFCRCLFNVLIVRNILGMGLKIDQWQMSIVWKNDEKHCLR